MAIALEREDLPAALKLWGGEESPFFEEISEHGIVHRITDICSYKHMQIKSNCVFIIDWE